MVVTRVKVCGITRTDDARIAVEAGADALGFVLAPSPRRVEPAVAREIARSIPPFVSLVGVFVDAPLDEVREMLGRTGIDTVQLHGDESPEYCAEIERPVLKRIRVEAGDTADDLRRRVARYAVAGCLLDPGAGDGEPFDWKLARDLPLPTVLAGGLHAENVAEALRSASPFGVDASSGLEDAPGRKNAARVRAFVDAVRREDAR
ncbi:MAG: phosphoribosylanthranilate isomerase [bacterium]|nr:phosphoribosylanthranilate isomerase [bacterium]